MLNTKCSFRIAYLQESVHLFALHNFDDVTVTGSCVALLMLLQGDFAHLQNHLQVANLLLSNTTTTQHCSLEERSSNRKRAVAEIGKSNL